MQKNNEAGTGFGVIGADPVGSDPTSLVTFPDLTYNLTQDNTRHKTDL
jgi:hypothetical protein